MAQSKKLVSIQFPELGKTLERLGDLPDKQAEALGQTMYEEYEVVMTESKEQVPVDTGALRGSGHVQLPKIAGAKVEVEGGYGGPAGAGNHGGETNDEHVGYAVYVHEDLEASHPVGKAKYLEDPFSAAQPQIEKAMIGALNSANRSVG